MQGCFQPVSQGILINTGQLNEDLDPEQIPRSCRLMQRGAPRFISRIEIGPLCQDHLKDIQLALVSHLLRSKREQRKPSVGDRCVNMELGLVDDLLDLRVLLILHVHPDLESMHVQALVHLNHF